MLERIEKARQTIHSVCSRWPGQISIMEVCGTHTVAIFRSGIRSLLPKNLKLLSGPGCPVCVTDQSYIDSLLDLAQSRDTLIATYGDMVRVPGSFGSMESLPNVRVVLSADDALMLARNHPDKIVIFAAVGFETTAPGTAVVVQEAAAEGIDNFRILCGHKRVVPAMKSLLTDRNDKIDAFLCPGHVSVILGSDAYKPVAETFRRPCVAAGFESVQILEGLAAVCRQKADGRAVVESVYGAVVTPQGNKTAQQIMDNVFEPWDAPWRGLGIIQDGSLKLRKEFRQFDAAEWFKIRPVSAPEPIGCCCGRVLCGLIDPPQCPLFGCRCTPDAPVGPCMVSTEGVCAAWYKYGR